MRNLWLLVGVVIVTLLPAIALAQSVPPHLFQGNVVLHDRPAPDGTTVTAFIEGSPVASAIVRDGKFFILIQQPVALNYSGKQVTFVVDDDIIADQTVMWRVGGQDILILTAGSIGVVGGGGGLPEHTPAPTLAPTPTSTPRPTPAPTLTPTDTPRPTPGHTPGHPSEPTYRPTPIPTTPSPTTSTSIIDELIRYLEAGNIAFNAPSEMSLGQAVDVELLLSSRESIQVLKNLINQEGATEGAEIEIANKMKSKLSGIGFDVVELTDEVQAISNFKVTR